ncbi:MAG: hydrogenase maturation protease [Armatimonadetes bacterium]|nr:hydrogenase maturation protease [Armatimonadota bacterium]
MGVLVARRLCSEQLGPDVEVIEGHTGGLNLLFDIEGADRCIIVDAVEMGRPPGTIEVFDADDADIIIAQRIASLHHVSLADVVQLARATGIETQITVVGIQPKDVGPGEGLSSEIAAKLEELVSIVRELLQQKTVQ